MTGSDTAGPRVGKTVCEKASLLPRSCAVSCHLAAVGVSRLTCPLPATGKASVSPHLSAPWPAAGRTSEVFSTDLQPGALFSRMRPGQRLGERVSTEGVG